jgi:uncharacterized membrane protein YfhO
MLLFRMGRIRYLCITLKWDELSKSHLLIETETEHEGNLVVTRNSIPGWQSTLDQKSLAVGENADGLVILKIPSGKHVVDLKFVPPGFYAGAVISLGTLMVFLITLATAKGVHRL